METQTTTLAFEKGTKRKYRYEEESTGQPPVIGTLYVQQRALGEEPPDRLAVTISEPGDE